jgi:hypothetical protein
MTANYFVSGAVNGVCGASNNKALTAAPITGLCSIGSASAVTGSGPWSWNCSGLNGGLPASCAANLLTLTTPPVVINSAAPTTANPLVTLALTYPGAAKMQFLVNNVRWTALENFVPAKAGLLPLGDGVKTVYVRFIDVDGNSSATYACYYQTRHHPSDRFRYHR